MKTASTSDMGVLQHGYTLIMATCGAIAAIIFGLMSLLIGFDVILRNLGYDWIPSSVELSEYMLMIATFAGAPWLLHHNGHIRVDVIVNKLPTSVARQLEVLCNLIGIVVCATLTWQSYVIAMDNATNGTLVFKELVFPEWWLNLPLLAASTLLTIEFCRRLRQSIHQLRQQGD